MIEKLLVPLLLGVALVPTCASAQIATPTVATAPLPSFEVASVKPGDPETRQSMLMMGLDSMSSKNVPLKALIVFAYGLKSDSQLLGLPDSLAAKKFDIEAKQGEEQAAENKKLSLEQRNLQVRLMLQSLLVERFKLKVSHQTKEFPIYAIVIARGGLKMTPAAVPPVAPKPEVAEAPDGRKLKAGRMVMSGRGKITGEEIPIGVLADLLSRQTETGGRVVVDKTGLTGSYNIALKWTPESAAPMTAGGGDVTPEESTGPAFFTAVQEQLGLKLESQRGPVEVLVVEHVEEPSAN